MKSVDDVMPAVRACVENAERLHEAAKATSKAGSYHIAYHLAALALEEIGKSSMIFMSALKPAAPDDEGPKGPAKWIDDHERKLFWALWLPITAPLLEWQTIPESLELARKIHNNRLETLYVDPSNLTAAPINESMASSLISLTEARLGIERLKQYRELDEEASTELQWFFAALDHPDLRPLIFSKGSLEKQAEFRDDYGAWMKWMRETIEEADRKSIELTRQEMLRLPEEGAGRFEDKFEVKIRLRSWSHSIRAKELKEWNLQIEKFKLSATNERDELVVTMMIAKAVKTEHLWQMGWQASYAFVTALNIGTLGFFWWYVPKFTSRFYDKIRDVEHGNGIVVERVPELNISWGNLVLKSESLSQVMIVFGLIAHATNEQFQALHRYFRTLGLLAKNDIFYQFEPTIIVGLMIALKDALKAYGDWDGYEASAVDAMRKAFTSAPEAEQIVGLANESLELEALITSRTNFTRPITLEDVGKAKVCFEGYIILKARRHFAEDVVRMKAAGIEPGQ